MKLSTPFHIENLGRMDTRWIPSRAEVCEYVNEGEEVIVATDLLDDEGKVLCERVIIECAAGVHARVKGKTMSGWYHVNDLARPKERENQSA